MLEKGNFVLNQRIFGFYSSLGFIPLEFSDNFTRATYQRCGWRVGVWRTYWIVAFVLELFKTFRLFQSLVHPELLILEHLMVHMANCFLLFVALYTTWNLSRNWPEIVAIFNYSFSDLSPGASNLHLISYRMTLMKFFANSGRTNTNSLEYALRKLRTLTRSDLILVTILPAFAGGTGISMGLFAHDPTRSDFMYSVIPEKYQHQLLLYFCLLIELFVMNFAICNASFAGIVQLGIFRKCLLDLKTRLVAGWRPPLKFVHGWCAETWDTYCFFLVWMTAEGTRKD